jgi:hypothetical protein
MAAAALSPAAFSGGLSSSLAPSPLAAELEATATSFLAPHAFFVSWQGVLTLAYRLVGELSCCHTRARQLGWQSQRRGLSPPPRLQRFHGAAGQPEASHRRSPPVSAARKPRQQVAQNFAGLLARRPAAHAGAAVAAVPGLQVSGGTRPPRTCPTPCFKLLQCRRRIHVTVVSHARPTAAGKKACSSSRGAMLRLEPAAAQPSAWP